MENDPIKFQEAEVTKLNVRPGEILMVTVYADDITPEHLRALKVQLQALFPGNKIMLFAMPIGSKIEMDVLDTRPADPLASPGPFTVSGQPAANLSSCAEPASYCNDCACGKKERIEGEKK